MTETVANIFLRHHRNEITENRPTSSLTGSGRPTHDAARRGVGLLPSRLRRSLCRPAVDGAGQCRRPRKRAASLPLRSRLSSRLLSPRPRPQLKRRVLRSCVATETALQQRPPALRSTPRAPGRHRAVVPPSRMPAGRTPRSATLTPSLRACHSSCFATRHERCQALRSPPAVSPFGRPHLPPRCSRVALLRSFFAYAVSGSRTMNSTAFRPSSVCLHPRPLITHSESQHRNSAPQLLATQIVQFDHVVPLAERVPFVPHSTRSAASPPFSSLHNLLAALPRLASSPPCGRAASGLRDRMRSSASSGTQPDTPSLRSSAPRSANRTTPSRRNRSAVVLFTPPRSCPTARDDHQRPVTLADDRRTPSPLPPHSAPVMGRACCAARPTPVAPFAPSGVSLRSTSSSPAAFPCCASSFTLRLRGRRLPCDTRSLRCRVTHVRRRPLRLITQSESQHRNAAPLVTPLHNVRGIGPLRSPIQRTLFAPCTPVPLPDAERPSGMLPHVAPSRSNCSVLHYVPNAALRTAAPITCPAAARGGALADTATQSPLARTYGRLPMAPVTLAMDRQPSVLDRTASHKLPPKDPARLPSPRPKRMPPPGGMARPARRVVRFRRLVPHTAPPHIRG